MNERVDEVLRRAAAEICEIITEEVTVSAREEAIRLAGEALEGLRRPKANGNGHAMPPQATTAEPTTTTAPSEEVVWDFDGTVPEEVEAKEKAPKSKKTKTKTKTTKSGKPTAKAARAADAVEAVLAFVRKNPKLRSEEIQKATAGEIHPDVIRASLAKLRADGRVKTRGNKRSTIYIAASA